MAELPSPEESARAILNICQSQGLRAGDDMPLRALEQGFSGLCVMALNFKISDWHDGLRFALAKGWLIKNGDDIQLTSSGHAAM
jgi:hypothetical protein